MFIQNFEEYSVNEFVNPKNLNLRKVLGWIIPPFTIISILLYSIRTISKLLMLSKQISREQNTEKKERSIFKYMTVKKEYLQTLLSKENDIQTLQADIKKAKKIEVTEEEKQKIEKYQSELKLLKRELEAFEISNDIFLY